MHYEMSEEITYSFPIFNGAPVDARYINDLWWTRCQRNNHWIYQKTIFANDLDIFLKNYISPIYAWFIRQERWHNFLELSRLSLINFRLTVAWCFTTSDKSSLVNQTIYSTSWNTSHAWWYYFVVCFYNTWNIWSMEDVLVVDEKLLQNYGNHWLCKHDLTKVQHLTMSMLQLCVR